MVPKFLKASSNCENICQHRELGGLFSFNLLKHTLDNVECSWYKAPLGMSYNIVTSNEHTLKARLWAFLFEGGGKLRRQN